MQYNHVVLTFLSILSFIHVLPTITYCAFIKVCSDLLSFLSFELYFSIAIALFSQFVSLLGFRTPCTNLCIIFEQSRCPGFPSIKCDSLNSFLSCFTNAEGKCGWKKASDVT